MNFIKTSNIPKFIFFFIFLLIFPFCVHPFDSDFSDSKINIIIDPGHGGNDKGGKTLSNLYEKDFNLYLAFAIKNNLNKNFKVTLTRTSDYSMTDTQRVDIANSGKNKLFISIHSGSLFTQTNSSNIFIGYNQNSEDIYNDSFPWSVFKNQFKIKNKKVTSINASFNIASKLLMPFVLIETGNLNSASQAITMKSPEYINDIAATISKGIIVFFEKKIEN